MLCFFKIRTTNQSLIGVSGYQIDEYHRTIKYEKKNCASKTENKHTFVPITIFCLYKKNSFKVFFLHSKFLHRWPILSETVNFSFKLGFLSKLLLSQFGTRQFLLWLCLFSFSASYLDGFLTFYTQAIWYKVNKAQSSRSCFCLPFLSLFSSVLV